MAPSTDPAPGTSASRAARAALEARRAQALADLADVDLQVSEGELDEDTALRLRARYGAELADAVTALDAPQSGHSARPEQAGQEQPPAPPRTDTTAATSSTAPDDRGDPDDPAVAEDAPAGRSRRRTVVTVAVAVLALVVVGVLAQMAVKPRSSTGSASGSAADSSTDTTRDLSTVSNQEMEDVIASNPDIVPMRLALVERYLQAGDATKAHDHAQQAFDRATSTVDKARAERYLGWSTSLLGDPATGATLLADSLVLEPANPDALWFLAIVRYRGLNTPSEAVPLLQQLLDQDIPDAQRTIVTDKLTEIRAVIAGGGPTASTGSTTATAP